MSGMIRMMAQLMFWAGCVIGQHAASAAAVSSATRTLPDRKLTEPLPVSAVLAIRQFYSYMVDSSPNGQWVAYVTTVPAEKSQEEQAGGVLATGAPDGSRLRVDVAEVRNGRVVSLGTDQSFSWAPVWSSDSERLAYYSDEGGEVGLWVWERASGRTQRFPGVTPWPHAMDRPGRSLLWSADGQRMIGPILSEGMSVAQANPRHSPRETPEKPRSSFRPDEPSVTIERCCEPESPQQRATAPSDAVEFPLFPAVVVSDLALLDLREGTVRRLVKGRRISDYKLSPDEKYLVYLELKRATRYQNYYDLLVLDLRTGQERVLGERLPILNTVELTWSPDSRRIAYIEGGNSPSPSGEVVMRSIDGTVQRFAGEGIPKVGTLSYSKVLWDATGRFLYTLEPEKEWAWLGARRLKRIELSSGRMTTVAEIPEHVILHLYSRSDGNTLWSGLEESTIWVMAHKPAVGENAIFSIDLTTGHSHRVTDSRKRLLNHYLFEANESSGQIVYGVSTPHDPGNLWRVDTKRLEEQQITRLNAGLDRYVLGNSRLLEYSGADGPPLRAALLLPPDYRPGRRLPMAVWVYMGEPGSRHVNQFGLAGSPVFNMQVLATRGYAVLWPDVPVARERKIGVMRSTLETVMAGVEAAIAQGYADPGRLAVMGHSAGSFTTLALISQTTRFKAAIFGGNTQHPDLSVWYVGGGTTDWAATGTPWSNREGFIENSPFFFFDRIKTPILLGQGSLELQGPISANPMDFIISSLKRLRKEAEYRIYHGEGHVISMPPNVIDFWNRRLEFLAHRLNLVVDQQGKVVFAGDQAQPRY